MKTNKPINVQSPTINKTVSQTSHNSNLMNPKLGANLQQRILSENNGNDSTKINGGMGRPMLARSPSKLSHVTRDVNDSYAYTNVQQYIEENDLMPPEKAHTIKKWVREVNSVVDDWEKKTIEKHIEDLFL